MHSMPANSFCLPEFFFLSLSVCLSASIYCNLNMLCIGWRCFLLFVLLLILFIIEKSANKNHIFSHTFGYYCRIYFDKQLICMSNKLWRLHESTANGQSCRYKYQMYDFTQIKFTNDSLSLSHSIGSTLNGIQLFSFGAFFEWIAFVADDKYTILMQTLQKWESKR